MLKQTIVYCSLPNIYSENDPFILFLLVDTNVFCFFFDMKICGENCVFRLNLNFSDFTTQQYDSSILSACVKSWRRRSEGI